jgi:hypothetical protein
LARLTAETQRHEEKKALSKKSKSVDRFRPTLFERKELRLRFGKLTQAGIFYGIVETAPAKLIFANCIGLAAKLVSECEQFFHQLNFYRIKNGKWFSDFPFGDITSIIHQWAQRAYNWVEIPRWPSRFDMLSCDWQITRARQLLQLFTFFFALLRAFGLAIATVCS